MSWLGTALPIATTGVAIGALWHGRVQAPRQAAAVREALDAAGARTRSSSASAISPR